MQKSTMTFSEKIGEVAEDLRGGLEDIASAYMYLTLVERITEEAREVIGTPGEVDPDTAFENAFQEATMELVLAFAEQTGAPCSVVTKTVDDFMSTHVKADKDAILSEVDSNLLSDPETQKSTQTAADNDV